MNKKIDVIIPAYKAQETIIRTLGSIIIQSIVSQLQVTIVNDADENDYQEIVNQFKPFVDVQEIKLEKNGGPGVARQYGIDNTKNKYLTFIDADDTFASPFALEILLNQMEKDPINHTVIGGFLEEHPGLKFINHQQDMVWMFGKLYTRAFLEKYNVRFNETRANEDNGFNTIIRLCSSDQEKIMFISDIVYYWHFKEDSITRINNAEYSYNQSFPGYTENMIYAIKKAREVKPFNSYIDMWAIQIMAQLYIYYLQTVKRDPRYKDQNFKWCRIYYREVFEKMLERFNIKDVNAIFSQIFTQQSVNMQDIVPEETIWQFIDRLKIKEK